MSSLQTPSLEVEDLGHSSPKTKEARPIRLSHGCLLEGKGRDALGGPHHQLRYLEGSSFIGLMGAIEFIGATGFMGFTGISSKGFT